MSAPNPVMIEQARREFFDGKGLPVNQVSHAILRSWMRCTDMGLNARRAPPHEAPTSQEVRDLHDRHEALRRLCRAELDALYNEAREMSGLVILTNAQGIVLDTLGDAAFADRAAQVTLRPGVLWSEDGTGTNAIGTALAERRGVSVFGGEHYFTDHKVLSCAATPIIDHRGAIIGVLDMSAPATDAHTHMLGMVRLAVEQIEHRLFREGFDGCETVRFQTDPGLLGVAREGILVVKDGVIVGANRRGLSLIGHGWDILDEMRFEDVFAHDVAQAARDGHLTAQDGRAFAARLDTGARAGPASFETVPGQSLDDIELSTIRAAVEAHKGNISAAARHLGIHRSTIYRRLQYNV
ncbi:helix-turn-helix domain-containing protein [Asticcacaulis sp. SL142]|uniref:sigma-54-dependent Fis family transcriptional regulator n=1 Tax=Asticcacaulis sp. SL142 TaxID=2995155 RepID=UPI00226C6674|nr:helix-turn-helix domain-containing protein [Asticcacaulis sp. SL142]WAC49321.1 helix-turn-helix domain-containing protein [Asticcacaulis sp. SL142]